MIFDLTRAWLVSSVSLDALRLSTEISSALDQLTMSGATPKHPRDKVMRLATMTKQLLDEVRTHPLDIAGLHRLRTIDSQIIGELLTDLTPDLRQELQLLAPPLTRHTELSDAELRLAHAQLVGWLHGLLQTTQTALSDPHTVAANDSKTVQTAPNHLDRPHVEPCSSTKLLPDDSASSEDNQAIRSARQTLLTAITGRHPTTPHRSSGSRRTPSHRPEGDPTTPNQHRRIHTR